MRDSHLVVVDVRPAADCSKGHIQGARNIPAPLVQTAGLPKDAEIVVYCGEATCPLSQQAAEALNAFGYSNVSVLAGGFAAWKKAGYPVVTDAEKRGEARQLKIAPVRASDAQKRLGTGALAIDVRPAMEFKAGHLPGAKNYPLETLSLDMVRLPKGAELIVYDRRQDRVKQALTTLTGAGFKAEELSGGLVKWIKEKRPLAIN